MNSPPIILVDETEKYSSLPLENRTDNYFLFYNGQIRGISSAEG